MEKQLSDIILDDKKSHDKIKGTIPNTARIFGMYLLFLLIPSEAEVFHQIDMGLIASSVLWLGFDFFRWFDSKILASIPATIDFVGVIVGLYITGAGNSLL